MGTPHPNAICGTIIGAYKPINVDRVSRSDWYARLAEIPPDTRDLTGKLLGDPIPGDRRRFSPAHRPKITLPGFA